MSRLRITFTSAALLLALAALTLNSLAQPPGPGGPGGGGGRGGRGGGPGGGFGGPGGFGGGSLLMLATNPGVQADMKVTEKQKAQIKSLNEKFNAKMQEFWGQMGGPGGRGQGGGGPQGQGQGRGRNGNRGNGGNAQNGQVGGGDVQGQVPDAQAGGGGGNLGNGNQNGQAIPEDPEVAQQRAEQREMMREAMTELRQSAETSLGRILDKGQATRLKQIQLQLEGPSAVLREDMMEKLNIDEAQVEMIREIQGENRNLQRETGRARRDMMKTAFAKMTPSPRNNGQDGGADANNGGGANNGNGNNGRNGGGRGGRPNFDPEAMRKVMESPEVKAQMEQIQSQDQKLSNQFAAAVKKVLTPRQRAAYKKMLGPPFDRSQMMGGGGPWGGRGGFGPGANQATAKGAAAAKAKATDDGDDETPKGKTAVAAPAKAKATTPKRQSLRDQRGEAPSDDN